MWIFDCLVCFYARFPLKIGFWLKTNKQTDQITHLKKTAVGDEDLPKIIGIGYN